MPTHHCPGAGSPRGLPPRPPTAKRGCRKETGHMENLPGLFGSIGEPRQQQGALATFGTGLGRRRDALKHARPQGDRRTVRRPQPRRSGTKSRTARSRSGRRRQVKEAAQAAGTARPRPRCVCHCVETGDTTCMRRALTTGRNPGSVVVQAASSPGLRPAQVQAAWESGVNRNAPEEDPWQPAAPRPFPDVAPNGQQT